MGSTSSCPRLLASALFLILPPPPRSTLFPYTTLFRSNAGSRDLTLSLSPSMLSSAARSGGRWSSRNQARQKWWSRRESPSLLDKAICPFQDRQSRQIGRAHV